ncbi:MAG: phosphate acyltransferase PlsX [Proteobacteria bacterium]|nr:phosphate acyltransferase PlsX [Pseudomonadota bacterium]MBW3617553.1 phosphate acyltransferase PlsX [Pseudomonadota bacterium]
MGGDHGPSVVVPAVARACERLDGRPVRFLLHGDAARLEPELARTPAAACVTEVRHTPLLVSMDEKPAYALRRSKGSSLWNAIESVKSGEAQAVVSAGNTGALMAISRLVLRMTEGMDRPAIVANWPSARGICAVLDVGANVVSDAEQLVQFAIMGSAFHRAVHGQAHPTVGLLNVGSEEMKGHEEVREAHRLLSETGLEIDYRGFVEGDDIAKGTVDVVVTDGFTGNVALKTAEGTARFISALLRETLTSSLWAKLGALSAAPALQRMKDRIDPRTINGGPLLGLNGIVVKSHGGTDAVGFGNAIKVAADLARSDYASEIDRNMRRLSTVLHSDPATAQAAE